MSLHIAIEHLPCPNCGFNMGKLKVTSIYTPDKRPEVIRIVRTCDLCGYGLLSEYTEQPVTRKETNTMDSLSVQIKVNGLTYLITPGVKADIEALLKPFGGLAKLEKEMPTGVISELPPAELVPEVEPPEEAANVLEPTAPIETISLPPEAVESVKPPDTEETPGA